jgi:anion-transporting  ArsA/GET3 family ATPase
MRHSLEEVLTQRSLVVCVGSGGVGKTSMAAAMGLWAAAQGRQVLVLTIDPARRLANSLGMEEFGNVPVKVKVEGLKGQLSAMMLDTASTFESLVDRLSMDEETRQAIRENRVYGTVQDAFSGSQEYMAGEALYDVVSSGDYDLVVLDTPPAKNALDFLDASDRFLRFLDPNILKWFLSPYDEGKVFGKLMAGTSAVVFRLLSYVFGKEFLQDLSEFLLYFKDLYDGFRERHHAVLAMLESEDTAFLVVCAPTEASVEVAGFFASEFRRRELPYEATVINQVLPCGEESLDPNGLLGEAASARQADHPPGTSARVLARLGAAHRRLRESAAVERDLIAKVRSMMSQESGLLVEVPRIEGEVHDLAALWKVTGHLVPETESK